MDVPSLLTEIIGATETALTRPLLMPRERLEYLYTEAVEKNKAYPAGSIPEVVCLAYMLTLIGQAYRQQVLETMRLFQQTAGVLLPRVREMLGKVLEARAQGVVGTPRPDDVPSRAPSARR